MWIHRTRLSRRVDDRHLLLPHGCNWLGTCPPIRHGTRRSRVLRMQSRACLFAMMQPGVACTHLRAFVCSAVSLQYVVAQCRVWCRHEGPILVLRATHSAIGCVPWAWNDQTGNTNRLPIRRVDSPYMSPACCQSLPNAFWESGAAMEVPSLY